MHNGIGVITESTVREVNSKRQFDELVQGIVAERRLKFSEQRQIAKARKNEEKLARIRRKQKRLERSYF